MWVTSWLGHNYKGQGQGVVKKWGKGTEPSDKITLWKLRQAYAGITKTQGQRGKLGEEWKSDRAICTREKSEETKRSFEMGGKVERNMRKCAGQDAVS